MNYRMEQRGAFEMVGITRHFKAPQESGVVKPAFWNELFANGVWQQLDDLSGGEPKGVHGYMRMVGEGAVDYTIACVSDAPPPQGMARITVPAATWAVFELVGPPNCSMEEGWRRIFAEWLPTSGYRLVETGELECFPHAGDRLAEDFHCEIRIPVEKA